VFTELWVEIYSPREHLSHIWEMGNFVWAEKTHSRQRWSAVGAVVSQDLISTGGIDLLRKLAGSWTLLNNRCFCRQLLKQHLDNFSSKISKKRIRLFPCPILWKISRHITYLESLYRQHLMSAYLCLAWFSALLKLFHYYQRPDKECCYYIQFTDGERWRD
jgi:hypothetical protein